MVKRAGTKRGDTLVEVMLAVGIFSMVAISVVSVISGSTSSAQTALEATLTREEIDAQAEALRFVHSAYAANPNPSENPLAGVWEDITSDANVVSGTNISDIVDSYPPSRCDALYTDDGIFGQKAFVINTHKLANFTNSSEVFVSTQSPVSKAKFRAATTYPHLVFGDNTSLVDEGSSDTLTSIDGIYVIAVEDSTGTNIVGGANAPAFYDFYIRTCWYGTGDQAASTISTVIRLYNPKVMAL